MQRNYQFHRDKKLLALERERRALRPRLDEKVQIDPPIQLGWVYRWRLTKFTECHPRRKVFEDILSEVQVELHLSHRLLLKVSKIRQRLHSTEQRFRSIPAARWQKLNWSDAHKACFRPEFYVTPTNRFIVRYHLTAFEFFERGIERRWVKELPRHQPDLCSRLAEIETGLGLAGTGRLDNLHGQRCYKPEPRHAAVEKAAKMRMVRVLRGEWDAERRQRARCCLSASPAVQIFIRGRQLTCQAT